MLALRMLPLSSSSLGARARARGLQSRLVGEKKNISTSGLLLAVSSAGGSNPSLVKEVGEELGSGEDGGVGEDLGLSRLQSVCLPTVFLPSEMQEAIDAVLSGE